MAKKTSVKKKKQQNHSSRNVEAKNDISPIKRPQKTALRENVEAVVVALVLALLVRTFIFQAFKIPSGSMMDTLLIGDHILVNKFIYTSKIPYLNFSLFPVRDPERKDIIVFKFPKDPKRDFIKRCIAKPNDILQIRNHDIWINNEKQDEHEYIRKEEPLYLQSREGRAWENMYNHVGPKKIPKNQYFMMGDNRDNSRDSRFWGTLDHKLIKGKAFLIYFSLENGSGLFWKRIRWNRFFKQIY